MKAKYLVLIVCGLLFVNKGISQEGDSKGKNWRFGLKIAPSVNWLTPVDKREYNGGSGLGFNWGLVIEKKLAERISISSGFEVNHEKGKIDFIGKNSAGDVDFFYYIDENYDFVETEQNANGNYVPSDTSNIGTINLLERKYSNTYVTIPFGIKMKSSEIGYITYFGEFGGNFSLLWNSRVADAANANLSFTPNGVDQNDLKKLSNYQDMQIGRIQLAFGGGLEYNLSGTTSLFGALHYNLGFTNVARKNSKYLVNSSAERISQNFSAHGIRLTVGVLF